MATYERLLADTSVQRAEADEQPQQLGKPALTPAQQRMRYLKIGGAAVAGGALLAVTGGKLHRNGPQGPQATCPMQCMHVSWYIRPQITQTTQGVQALLGEGGVLLWQGGAAGCHW